jgi:hypothetical protein
MSLRKMLYGDARRVHELMDAMLDSEDSPDRSYGWNASDQLCARLRRVTVSARVADGRD